jgi:biotin carboxyl carrier protein
MKAPKRKVKVIVDGEEYIVEVGDLDTRPITVMVDGEYYQVEIEEDEIVGVTPSPMGETSPPVKAQPQKVEKAASRRTKRGNAITAPLPGDVVDILVHPGESVTTGQAVCVVEAMKMKNTIRSPLEGLIASVEVAKGEAVQFGDVLMTFE